MEVDGCTDDIWFTDDADNTDIDWYADDTGFDLCSFDWFADDADDTDMDWSTDDADDTDFGDV